MGLGEEAKTLFKRVAAKMANTTGQYSTPRQSPLAGRDCASTNNVIALRGYRGHKAPLRSASMT